MFFKTFKNMFNFTLVVCLFIGKLFSLCDCWFCIKKNTKSFRFINNLDQTCYVKVLFLLCVMSFHSLDFSCSCCKKNRIDFFLNFPKGEYKQNPHSTRHETCDVCRCEIGDNSCVLFVCSQQQHFTCLDCFFRGFVSSDQLSGALALNTSKFKCPFCVQGMVGIASLKYLFLESGLFSSVHDNKDLKNIKKLLENKSCEEETCDVSLGVLKEQFKAMNSDCDEVKYKPCPCCNVAIYKDTDTCNAVICTVCGCVFCWLCGWCTFGLINTGHEHYWAGDCVEKGKSDLMYGFFDIATYYGREYLFGNAPYQKPRFFLHAGCESFQFYLAMKDKIADNFQIEDTLKDYRNYGFGGSFKPVPGKTNEYTYEPSAT